MIPKVKYYGPSIPSTYAVNMTAAASGSNGITVADDDDIDFGTGDFAVFVNAMIASTRPASNQILHHKHDGTTGVIVTLLTTGIVRLTLNATTFDSTVALTSASNVEPVIIIPVARETTTAAGSVTFVVDGVQLGTALAISARVEKITNGNFDTDITGWTLATGSGGSIAWEATGKIRIARVTTGAAYQAVSLAAGETLFVSCVATWVSGGSTVPSLAIKAGTAPTGVTTHATQALSAAASGTLRVSYYSAAGETVYVHLQAGTANGTYDFDTVTSLDTHSVDNASNLYLLGTSTTRTAGYCISSQLYNFAPSAAEVLDLCTNGIPESWKWGSQAAVYAGNFSVDADGFTGTAMTVDGNIDGIDGVDNVLRGTCSSTGTGRRIAKTVSITAGLKYSIEISVNFPVANVSADSFLIWNQAGAPITATSLSQTNVTKGAWQTFYFEFVADTGATGIRIYTGASASTAATTTLGDIMYVSAIEIKKIGATFAALPETIPTSGALAWTDSSGNTGGGTLPAAGATKVTIRK